MDQLSHDSPSKDPIAIPPETFGPTPSVSRPAATRQAGDRHDLKISVDGSTKKKHHIRRWIFGALMIIGALMVGAGIYAYQFTKNNITDKTNQLGFFQQVQRIIDKDVEPLKGEDNDRINILLLGQGGNNHPGGTLTDTIMLVSIQPSTNQVALLSFPRDLTVPFYLNGSTYPQYLKINNAVYYGGVDLAKEKITDVTGLDVHYYALIDFDAFRDIIEALGGVDVEVERSFDGYYGTNQMSTRCPSADTHVLDDGPYCVIRFDAGTEHMDGERALMFARIRKLARTSESSEEGGDFARAARQQKILEAIRTNVLKASTLLNPTKLAGILNSIGDHASTDMEIWEMLRFADIAKHVDSDAIINRVVADGEGGIVHSTRSEETGASIVIPNAGYDDFSEIQDLALHIFETTANQDAENVEALSAEGAVVVVQNGSSITGLAATSAEALQNIGLDIPVTQIGNGLTKLNTKTVVYDVSGGTNPVTSAVLAEYFGVTVVQSTIPSSTNSSVRVATDVDPTRVDVNTLPTNTDFIILLGSDAPSPSQNSTNTSL